MLNLRNSAGARIGCLQDWTRPKLGYQWKDGRSAKELANAWCASGSEPSCPVVVRELIDSHPLTRGAKLVEGAPEHVTPLPERGEGRNHDLWLRAEISGAPLTLCVEAKADEPFGELTGEYLRRAKRRSRNTGAVRRAQKLIRIVFGVDADPEALPYANLRYQLLTAAAGTVLQACRDGAQRAVLIVHEFRSAGLDAAKIQANGVDLAAFLSALSGRPTEMSHAALLGPWRMKPSQKDRAGVDLLIGKVVTDLP